MESIVEFFSQVSSSFRTSLLVGGVAFFWILEGVIPFYRFKYMKWKHASINVFFTLTTMVVGFGMAGVLMWISDYVVAQQFGIMHWMDAELWVKVVVAVLLMDLISAYFVHWVEHKVKWMWKFHLVHHSDTAVDVTTGLRHHPGETMIRITFTLLAVVVVGAPMGVVMLYQSLSVLFAHLTHANIDCFGRFDRAVSYFLVTPKMHKVHHHYQQPLTDTNFGNIFSIWDRIFGTFAYLKNMDSIKYGVDTHMKAEENQKIGNLLSIPFQKYRTPEDIN